ncbi:MAG: hypothetical protein J6Q05_06590, partial [Elusimicrobiaceae bacterium]|nr:hypothetical protein [Elusimicrobiaceae bacterium]
FQKMRAQDQLRFKKGDSINLSDNSALKIVKEEKFATDVIQRQRQAEKPMKHSTNTKPSLLPSVESAVVLPNNTSPNEPPKVPKNDPQPELLQAENVKPVKVYNQGPTFTQQKIREKTRNVAKLITTLVIKLPVFIIFTVWVGYVCYRLGSICSVNLVPGDGLLKNLVNPFFAPQYAPNQLLFMFLTAVTLLAVFISPLVKEYARSTVSLFFLALVSYMAGLFTPDAFLDLSNIFQYLFTPDYYLCYLVMTLVWGIGMCFVYNRTIMEGLLGGALVALVITLSYLAPHLSIPPAADIASFKILFFVALFSGIVSIYYLADRKEKTSVILPLVFLLVGSTTMWIYMVSGYVQTVRHTAQALIANIQVKSLSNAKASAQIEQDLGIESARGTFASFDKTTEVSVMTPEQKQEFFSKQLERIAPETFNEENADLFIQLLSNYYHGGESKMNAALWNHALVLPIENFSRDAANNSAYGFMMLLLMILSSCFCLGAIVFKED